ncbi:hypothetical protein GY12_09885 [Micrococcus luteus]|nr:hypothetical protein GY12_09885 [Micrococcus luteus]
MGNRAGGDRTAAALSEGALAAEAALLLTGPHVPMLFMGEEFAASTPWPFFTSFREPELGDAVRRGRRREFAAHGWDPADVPTRRTPPRGTRPCWTGRRPRAARTATAGERACSPPTAP